MTNTPAGAIPTLPAMGVLHRCHQAGELLQGFTEGVDGDGITALMDWALYGRMILAERTDLVSMFAAPHRAALDEGVWSGDPLAQAEADIARVEAEANALDVVNGGLTRTALEAFAHERLGQVSREGYTPEHDDEHGPGELIRAAATYAVHAGRDDSERDRFGSQENAPTLWPWEVAAWKPSSPLRDLEKAGALLLAGYEQLVRQAALATSSDTTAAAEGL